MDYQHRYFNDDPESGLLGVGYLKDVTLPPHSMVVPYYRCCVLLEGRGTISYSDGPLYQLQPGSVYQLFPDQYFQLIINDEEDWLEYRVCISKQVFLTLNSLQLLNQSPVFTIDLKTYLLQWMPGLLEDLKKTPQKELAEVFFNTQKFLLGIHRENIAKSVDDIDTLIESIKKVLDSSYESNINLDDIASSFQMSYEKLRKLYKEVTGQSPLQYHLQQKFRYAQRLITEGLSVKEAAARIGYADPYIFSKQFKKYVGRSPSHFKPKGGKQ